MAIEYHVGPRGTPGYTVTYTSGTGVPYRMVIPAYVQVDSSGNEVTPIGSQLPASLGPKTGATSLSVVPNTDTPFNVQGQQARGATITVQPVVSGGRGSTTAPTAVTAGQVVDSWSGLNGQTASMLVTSNGTLIAAATVSDGISSGTTTLSVSSFGLIYNGTTFDRLKKPNATARLIGSAASTNGANVKNAAGDLFRISGNNTVASKRYLKLYNKASAPTVGTDTPIRTICLLASAPFDIVFSTPYYFATGISYAITGAASDGDTTNIGAGDIECLNFDYA